MVTSAIALFAIIVGIDCHTFAQEKPTEAAVAVIDGKVVDEHGQGVADVSVRYFLAQSEGSATTTDAEGGYHLSVPAKPSALTIVADDVNGDRLGYRTTDAPNGANPKSLSIALKPVRHTLIKVVDAAGAPVAGATFTTPDCRQFLGDLLFTGKTNATGIGKLRYTEDAFVHQVVAFKSGVGFDYFVSPLKFTGSFSPPGFSADAKLGDPLPDVLIFKLNGARTLRIKSVDNSGAAVAGVIFQLQELTTKGKPWAVTNLNTVAALRIKTDADGIATFDWLPENFVGEMKFHGGGAPGQLFDTTRNTQALLTVYAKHPVNEITVPLLRRVKITGHVYGSDGKPAEGIKVQGEMAGIVLSSARGMPTTKADGSYSLYVANEKQCTVGIVNDRWTAPTQVVSPAANDAISDMDFHLTEGTIVRGKVTQAPDHLPVANQEVELSTDVRHGTTATKAAHTVIPIYGPSSFRRMVRTGPDGTYHFCVPPGNYALHLGQWEEDLDSRRFELDITNQREIVKDFEFPPIETAQLTGQLTDADGQPVAGQRVLGRCLKRLDYGNGAFQVTTNADGTFAAQRASIPFLIDTYTQNRTAGGAAIVGADQKEVAIQVLPLVTAHGRLVDEQKSPVTDGYLVYGIKVPTDFEASSVDELTPAGDGTFTLQMVIPGVEYAIFWIENRDSPPVKLKTFTAGKVQTLEIGDVPIPKQP